MLYPSAQCACDTACVFSITLLRAHPWCGGATSNSLYPIAVFHVYNWLPTVCYIKGPDMCCVLSPNPAIFNMLLLLSVALQALFVYFVSGGKYMSVYPLDIPNSHYKFISIPTLFLPSKRQLLQNAT